MPGVWARTSLIHNKRPRPPGISVKCTFVVSPRGRARKRAGQAQHAYPWPRDGLVPRVRSSMERVRAGEGDPDRAGGTPATARSRAPVPKTARTNARSPHLTYCTPRPEPPSGARGFLRRQRRIRIRGCPNDVEEG